MSQKKQQVRKAFRDSTFSRDKYCCVGCGRTPLQNEKVEDVLDAHHITPRENLPNGGYVASNGVTLCKMGNNCHLKAEEWLKNGTGEEGFSPEDLYRKIGSNRQKAERASQRLG